MNTQSRKEYVPVQTRYFSQRDIKSFCLKEAPATDDLKSREFQHLIRDKYGLRMVPYERVHTPFRFWHERVIDGYELYTDEYEDHFHFMMSGKRHALVHEELDPFQLYYTEGCFWCDYWP